MDAETIAGELAPHLKALGYKKRGFTWFRQSDALTVVFAVQRSQFGKDLWYYAFGTALHALTPPPVQSISKCQIQDKTEMRTKNGSMLTLEHILHLVQFWAEQYGDIRTLRIRAVQNKLPAMTERNAVRYLTKGGLPL